MFHFSVYAFWSVGSVQKCASFFLYYDIRQWWIVMPDARFLCKLDELRMEDAIFLCIIAVAVRINAFLRHIDIIFSRE